VANTVLLNNIDHKDLRVSATRGAALGDDVMCALTYPREFRDVQAEYPIVFARDPDAGFRPLALFGFRDGQNLFLDGERWDATYLPHSVQCQPFRVGETQQGPMVFIDLDHPRVGPGEPLFREHGGTSDYLEGISSLLLSVYEGMRGTRPFVDALQRHGLLEPFVLDIESRAGAQHRLAGFHTLHEERLSALDGNAISELGEAGHLEPLYMVLASLANLRKLIERQNRVLEQA
jgi:hypothetical protein